MCRLIILNHINSYEKEINRILLTDMWLQIMHVYKCMYGSYRYKRSPGILIVS